MRIVATAGHVDHGKSSLVRALTGTDPDRWREEKERGLTIDLGFAHLRMSTGEDLAFVDVPGHVRFVSNMLAGVGGVDAALFVVDPNEGWMPQTEEHLRILEYVGVRRGVVVLTKSDLVDSDSLELARLETNERLEGTFLADSPTIAVSSTTGTGLGDLLTTIESVLASTDRAADRARPRLFVDRVFAAKGSGTVVTGTLTHGALEVGDTVTITPSMRTARIRALQSLGREVSSAGPGSRLAINLAGIDHDRLRRGDVVVRDGDWHVTSMVDASITVLAALDHPLSRRGAHTVHVGSDEVPVRVRVLGPESIAPGESGFVRLHLSREVPLLPGDRYVLRESGRGETVGGGEVLDVAPTTRAVDARPDKDPDSLIARRGWIDVDDFRRLTGTERSGTVGRWIVDPDAWEVESTKLERLIDGAGAEGLDPARLDDRLRVVADADERWEVTGGRLRRRGSGDPLSDHPALELLRTGGCSPEPPVGIGTPELRRLSRAGIVFERDDIWFHVDALETARAAARELLVANPTGFTMSHFRDRLGITRKFAVPLATELDARGITRRRDDVRIAGPRLDR